jgi:hypothetical protein
VLAWFPGQQSPAIRYVSHIKLGMRVINSVWGTRMEMCRWQGLCISDIAAEVTSSKKFHAEIWDHKACEEEAQL